MLALHLENLFCLWRLLPGHCGHKYDLGTKDLAYNLSFHKLGDVVSGLLHRFDVKFHMDSVDPVFYVSQVPLDIGGIPGWSSSDPMHFLRFWFFCTDSPHFWL